MGIEKELCAVEHWLSNGENNGILLSRPEQYVSHHGLISAQLTDWIQCPEETRGFFRF